MKSTSISCDLSKFDELYSAAGVPEGVPDMSDIPDGEYAALVEDVTLANGSGTTPTLIWTFRIRGGCYSDRLLRKMRPVTERTIAWVKEDFAKCGLKLDVFSDLPNRIEELRGTCLPVLKRMRDGNDFGVHIQWPNKARSHSAEELAV
jgi:hypothetical protein